MLVHAVERAFPVITKCVVIYFVYALLVFLTILLTSVVIMLKLSDSYCSNYKS